MVEKRLMPDNEIQGRENRLFLLFKILVTGLLAFYIYTSVQLIDIFSTLKSANPAYIVWGFVLVIPNIYMQFIKWKIICNNLLNEKNNKDIWLSLFFGYSGGIATPFRLGEYLGRAMAFKEKGVIEVSAATLIDKLFVIFTVTFVGAFATILFLQIYYSLNITVAIILYILTLTIYILIFFIIYKNQSLQKKIVSWTERIKYLNEFLNSLWSFKRLGSKIFFTLALLNFVLCGVFIFQFAVLVAAYSNQNELLLYFWAGVLVMFFKTIIPPVTLGELGVREGASVFFLTKMGLNSAIALNASLSLFTVNILLPSVIGLILVLMKRKSGI